MNYIAQTTKSPKIESIFPIDFQPLLHKTRLESYENEKRNQQCQQWNQVANCIQPRYDDVVIGGIQLQLKFIIQ